MGGRSSVVRRMGRLRFGGEAEMLGASSITFCAYFVVAVTKIQK